MPPQTQLHGAGNRNPYYIQNLAEARQIIAEQDAYFRKLADEPRLVATVIDVRDNYMTVNGPGGTMEIHALPGAKVGYRAILHRNTLQALSLIPDETPIGVIVTARTVTGELVEADYLNEKRVFRSACVQVSVGDRLVVDESLKLVIGNLGKPPSPNAYSAKMSVSWEDIGGQEQAKAYMREAIVMPYAHPEMFALYGKKPVKGILMEGAPGCGKTILAKAAATEIATVHGANAEAAASTFAYIKGPEILSSFLGKTEERIREIFAAARAHKAAHGFPQLVFLDECDALLGARDRGHNTNMNATIVPMFLAEMDGLDDHAALFILATNRADMLDSAVVRKGRVDRTVRVGRPLRADARAIFEVHLRDRPLAPDVRDRLEADVIADLYSDRRVIRRLTQPDGRGDLGVCVRVRDFASGAMIADVVEQASTAAMQRDVAAGLRKPSGVTCEDLRWAIDETERGLANIDHREVAGEVMLAASVMANESANAASAANANEG